MLKSKSQSMQAPLALSSRNFLLLSNTKQLICKNIARTGVQTTLFKQTKQSKQKLRRSKNNTTVHKTIKTKCLEIHELFIDEEGDALGIPKLWRLYLLNISWGDMGWHTQAWAFVHSSSHYIILSLHLKIFLHTKLHTIFISNISLCKKRLEHWQSFGTARLFTKNTRYCSTSLKKVNSPKRNQKGIDKKQMQRMTEICQTTSR